ncbi:DUF4176 domain-containing protein [Streptococcus loxodontisalivarius]|uniref:DUF4176 domain-containing protein n=1 Tax=Streptococcus loxodontisalivarius TaxID=1349415 RepID=A0ABS2PUY6_9STRE|nr:DUF4176 domain-containing protein [Streptococcus loxodontisalivarius]MBM7643132.1 hypothetical protein [Streptococcus loxodontisalivarius]
MEPLETMQELLKEADFEQFEVSEDLVRFIRKYGYMAGIFNEAYQVFVSGGSHYHYKSFLDRELHCLFAQSPDEVIVSGDDYSFTCSRSDFMTLVALIDMVYTPIYPLGTVVELDVDKMPPIFKKSLDDTKLMVMLTGRKLQLREGYQQYILDYVGRLWPHGEQLGSAQFRVSNLMIKKVVFEGYRDDREEERAEFLRARQIAKRQRSTAFMSPKEAAAYYQIGFKRKEH